MYTAAVRDRDHPIAAHVHTVHVPAPVPALVPVREAAEQGVQLRISTGLTLDLKY